MLHFECIDSYPTSPKSSVGLYKISLFTGLTEIPHIQTTNTVEETILAYLLQFFESKMSQLDNKTIDMSVVFVLAKMRILKVQSKDIFA